MSRSWRRAEQSRYKEKKGKRSRIHDDDREPIRRHGRLLKRYEEVPDEAYTYFLQHQSDPAEW